MRKILLAMFIFVIPFVAGATVSSVVIVEVRYDAGAGNDVIRIFNPTDSTIDLTGWTLRDTASNDFTLPSSLSAGAAQTIVAHSFLNNGGDGIVLRDSSSTSIDSVYYEGASSGWDLTTTSSTQFLCRKSTLSNANDSSEWQVCDNPDTFGSRTYTLAASSGGSSNSKKGGRVRYGCKDFTADNFTRWARHRQSLCRYSFPSANKKTSRIKINKKVEKIFRKYNIDYTQYL